MMTKGEILRWLESLPDDAKVAIDEGGLFLTLVAPPASATMGEVYLEVGGGEDEGDDEE